MATTQNRSNHSLKDRVVIVTGGSGGIGRAACLALAREGAHVVVTGRTKDKVFKTVREVERQAKHHQTSSAVLGLALDVRREEDMEEMARQSLAQFERIDALVTCAGIFAPPGESGPRPLAEYPTETWDLVMETNLRGVFLSNRAVLKVMLKQGQGEIINVSSTSGRRGQAYAAAYSASKAAVIGLSESLAEEVRQKGIRVQVLLTGPVDTDIWKQNRPLPPPEQLLSADHVADFIAYLLTLPGDAILPGPVIAPFKRHRRPAWRAPGAGGVRA